MATLNEIEHLTREFADARDFLSGVVEQLHTEIEARKRAVMPAIKEAVARAAEAHDKLHAAIADSPEQFTKPRTQVFAGVRVGFTKQKGKVEVDDEAATIARIRKLVQADQAELLIRVRESVHKPAVYDLTAADLKRLGIRITDDGDAVVIKPVDSEIDKLVSALLDEAAAVEQPQEKAA